MSKELATVERYNELRAQRRQMIENLIGMEWKSTARRAYYYAYKKVDDEFMKVALELRGVTFDPY